VKLVDLHGKIGVVCNGSGLCMATNDMIHMMGSKSSNFVDTGGNTDHEQLEDVFVLLEENKSTVCILVNIFGGMLDIREVARTIIKCINRKYITKPLVIRLKGRFEKEAIA
jgi:succinyl-CoA synthetase beta subunit